jgi:hypothetical protein
MPSEEFTAAQPTPGTEFYTWTFPGAPVRIHLHLSVVERLSHEVRRAFESVPSHSVEIGGLLLGKADFFASPIIEIKDFEPFLSEYRADHKFILSEPDRRKLEKLLGPDRPVRADGLAVVGYYRSHIGEGLSLRPEDLSVAQAHFFDPASVFLLIKPAIDGSANAGFFFWDNGHIDADFTFLEFPFDDRQLSGARVRPSRLLPPEIQAPEESPEPPFPVIAEPVEADESTRASHRGNGPQALLYMLFTLLMIAFGAIGYQTYSRWFNAPAPIASDAPQLALQVERRGNDLRVSWNRSAPAILQAKQAVLSIRDGESQRQELRLDLDQLRNGSVLYTPSNNNVQFGLEVTGPGNGKTTESVLALTAPKPNTVPPTPIPTARAPYGSGQQAPPASMRDRKVFTPPDAQKDFGEPVRVVLVDPPAQIPGSAAPDSSLLPAVPLRTAPPPPITPAPEPNGNRVALPTALPYTPPRPVRQTQPVLSAPSRAKVASMVEVEVKVQIDETGRVVGAEPLPSAIPVKNFLVTAARNAALGWNFDPARRGDQPVSSEMVLKFQYRPASR